MKKFSQNYRRALGLAAVTAFAAVVQADPITVKVNGQPVVFTGAQPHMMGGQVFVPIRSVIEASGGTVDWNPVDKLVTAQKGTTKMEIQLPSGDAKVNGIDKTVDGPIHVMNGWTMVPARFIADSISATIDFDGSNDVLSLVTSDTTATTYPSSTEVTPTPDTVTSTPDTSNTPPDAATTPPSPDMAIPPVGSALKATLDKEISSSSSYEGEPISATLDTNGNADYFGLPDGTRATGHVTFVQPMRDGMPGILGISFDELVLNDGRTISINGTPIDAYTDIVTGEDGRWTANSSALSKTDLKFVGNGTTSGDLVSLVTDGSTATNEEIDRALPTRSEPSDVVIAEGTQLGIRIDR